MISHNDSPIVDIDHECWWRRSRAHHRHELELEAQARRVRRLKFSCLPGAAGFGLLVYELCQWTPVPALIILGVMLLLPFLTFLTEVVDGSDSLS